MLEIYEKKRKVSDPTYLRLVKDCDRIDLIAVDKHGEKKPNGLILCISKEGVKLVKGLNKDLGLPVSKTKSTVKCGVL